MKSFDEIKKELLERIKLKQSELIECDINSETYSIILNELELLNLEHKEISNLKEKGLNEDEFDRIKKMIYGGYVREYNDVAETARMFLADSFKGINSFDYIDEINSVKVEYGYQVLKEVFDEKQMVLSVVKKS